MKCIETWLALVIVGLATSYALAGGDCCDQCGCDCQPRKVCRLKCDVKKVPKVTYTCECEDFCVPGPSKKCGCTCETDCNGCEKCKPNMVPQCAKVKTKMKLYKHTEMKEEKVYKWVVEYVCDHCANTCGCANGVSCAAHAGGEAEEGHVEEPVSEAPPVPSSAAHGNSKFLESLFAK